MNSVIFSKFLLPVVLGLIMFNLGLSLTFRDFKRTFVFPKAIIIGLCCQMLLLPLIAFVLASISGLPQAIKVGLVIIAACPGGATSNLITYLLKGDVALSISLTSINSLLILFSIPAITYVALQLFIGHETLITLPFFQTVFKILVMILLPTLAGMLVKYFRSGLAADIEKYMKYITIVLLAVVFLFTFISSKTANGNSMHLYLETAPYALGLNITGMLTGYLVGHLAGFSQRKIITLIIEVGIQNSALAITIASSQVFLGRPEMAIPALIYGMFTFFNALLFGFIIKKRWQIKSGE